MEIKTCFICKNYEQEWIDSAGDLRPCECRKNGFNCDDHPGDFEEHKKLADNCVDFETQDIFMQYEKTKDCIMGKHCNCCDKLSVCVYSIRIKNIYFTGMVENLTSIFSEDDIFKVFMEFVAENCKYFNSILDGKK
jgi:hypothetical protein